MKKYSEVKKELLKNPEVQRAYNDLEVEYKTISKVIELRIKNNLTQKDLAKKMGTKQSAVARFENQQTNPTIGYLSKIASVFNKKLVIDFK